MDVRIYDLKIRIKNEKQYIANLSKKLDEKNLYFEVAQCIANDVEKHKWNVWWYRRHLRKISKQSKKMKSLKGIFAKD